MNADTELSDLWDRLLRATASHEHARSASLDVQAATLFAVETALDPLGHGSIADRLTQLWNRFDEVTAKPADLRRRELVLGDAEALAAVIRRDHATIERTWHQEFDRLAQRVERLNHLLLGRRAAPCESVDLELSGLVAIDVSNTDDARSRLCFEHPALLDGGPFRVAAIGRGTQRRTAVLDRADAEMSITGGSTHGSLLLINRSLPRLVGWMQQLTIAVVESMNRLHEAGTGLDGTTGLPLFDPAGLTPATFRVSPDVAGHPERLAAARAPIGPAHGGSPSFDTSTAMALARVGTDPTGPWDLLDAGVTELGRTVAELNGQADAARLAFRRAQRSMNDGSTSSLNRRLAGLLATQEALEASARMDATINGVIDTVEHNTGLSPT